MRVGAVVHDMRLGKTRTAIETVRCVRRGYDGEVPTLVCCPNPVRLVWPEEIQKFDPESEIVVIDDTKLSQLKGRQCMPSWVIINYDKLRLCIKTLLQYQWLAIISDECQKVKNLDAQVTRAFRQLRAPYRFALSGTPFDKPEEAWSIYDWLRPGYLGAHRAFLWRYTIQEDVFVGRGGRDGFVKMIVGYKHTEELKEKLAVLTHRQSRFGVRGMPDRVGIARYVPMNVEQSRVYREIRENFRARLMEDESEVVRNPNGIFIALQQITSTTRTLWEQDESGKLDALEGMLEEDLGNGTQAIIWCKFIATIEALKQRLSLRKLTMATIYGDTSAEARRTTIHLFQQGEIKVLVANPAVAGLGLDLSSASIEYFVDLPLSTSEYIQACDRGVSMQKSEPVAIVHLLSEGTVDVRLYRLLQQKLTRLEDTLGGGILTGLSKDEILGLI